MGERGIYWSCITGRFHSPSHNCAQKCAAQAINSVTQPQPLFQPCLGVQPFCDCVASIPHPVTRSNHQGYNSCSYRIKCVVHQPASASSCQRFQRRNHQVKRLSRNCQPVLNLALIPVRWHQGGSKIDCPEATSCFCYHDLSQGSGPVAMTVHQIRPFLILAGGWFNIKLWKIKGPLSNFWAFQE